MPLDAAFAVDHLTSQAFGGPGVVAGSRMHGEFICDGVHAAAGGEQFAGSFGDALGQRRCERR